MSIWSEPVQTYFSAREDTVPQALLFDLDADRQCAGSCGCD